MLTRDQIKATKDLPGTVVEVPEWGGQVLVRGLTGRERDRLEQSMLEMDGKTATIKLEGMRALLVVMGCIEPTFSKEDMEWLGEKNGSAVDRIATTIQRLSGLSKSDIGEMTGNFTVDQKGASSST